VLSPAAAPFVLFSAIVLALLLRPQGLFGGGSVR
jgi:branched-subunit amino acid ABC-type transport system permease component